MWSPQEDICKCFRQRAENTSSLNLGLTFNRANLQMRQLDYPEKRSNIRILSNVFIICKKTHTFFSAEILIEHFFVSGWASVRRITIVFTNPNSSLVYFFLAIWAVGMQKGEWENLSAVGKCKHRSRIRASSFPKSLILKNNSLGILVFSFLY